MKLSPLALPLALAALGGCGTDDHLLGRSTPPGFGATRWAITLGGAGFDGGLGVAFDGNGDVVAAAHTLDPPAVPDPFHDFANGALVTKRAGADGAELWTIVLPTTGDLPDAEAVAVDAANNVYVAGHYYQQMTVQSVSAPSVPQYAAYVMKISPGGTVQWINGVAHTTGDGFPMYLAAAPSGSVYAAFEFDHDATVPMTPPITLSAGTDGCSDVLVVAFDTSSGATQWMRTDTGPGNQGVSGLAAFANGDIVVAGTQDQGGSFEGAPLTASAYQNEWVARLSSTGVLAWQELYGDPAEKVQSDAIAITPGGDIALSFYTRLAQTPPVYFPAVAVLDGAGGALWEQRATGGGGFPRGLASRTDGAVIAAGDIGQFAIDLGAGSVEGRTYLAAYDPTAPTGTAPTTVALGAWGTPAAALAAVATDENGAVALTGSAETGIDLGAGPITANGAADIAIVVVDP